MGGDGAKAEESSARVRELERELSASKQARELLNSQLESLKTRWQSGRRAERQAARVGPRLRAQGAASGKRPGRVAHRCFGLPGKAGAPPPPTSKPPRAVLRRWAEARQQSLDKLHEVQEELFAKSSSLERVEAELSSSTAAREKIELLAQLQGSPRETKSELARLQALERSQGQSADEMSSQLGRARGRTRAAALRARGRARPEPVAGGAAGRDRSAAERTGPACKRKKKRALNEIEELRG